MKKLTLLYVIMAAIAVSAPVFAQKANNVHDLILQADALQDDEKFTQAIEKYREVIKIDPANQRAQYQLALVLKTTGKSNEAIPILEKLAATPTAQAEVFDLLGEIYNEQKNYDKAGAIFLKGAKAYPQDQHAQLNLTNFYLQQKRYPEAETQAIIAIRLDTQDEDSQRAYALAVTAQNKKAQMLLAWCSFLILDPDGDNSAEAYQTVNKLLAVQGNSIGQLAEKLQTEFIRIGTTAEQEKSKDFFTTFYASYFYKLAQTSYMPTLARGISVTAHPENKEWLQTHSKEVNGLAMWISTAARS